MELSEILKQLRSGKDLSQRDLAAMLNVSPSTIAMYETGQRKPDGDTLKQLADFFNVTTDYLLGRTNEYADFQPTPPERIRKFYKKVGELSPESLSLLEEQTEHLLRLEKEVLDSKRAERDAKQKNVDK